MRGGWRERWLEGEVVGGRGGWRGVINLIMSTTFIFVSAFIIFTINIIIVIVNFIIFFRFLTSKSNIRIVLSAAQHYHCYF